MKPITLRPVHPRDFAFLRRLDSVVVRHLVAISKGQTTPKTQYTAGEGAELIYVFSHPISHLEAELKRGREHFRRTAWQFQKDQNISAADGEALVREIGERLAAAITSAVSFVTKGKG